MTCDGNGLCQWVLFLCDWQHQQQVAAAVERAKQVTMQELNAIIGVSLDTSCSETKYNLYTLPTPTPMPKRENPWSSH